MVALNWPVVPITSVPLGRPCCAGSPESLWQARPATMEVLKRSSPEYAAVAAALRRVSHWSTIGCRRFSPSPVAFRHRHVDRLAILQGIGCELWNRPFSDFRVGPYFGPDLAHQTCPALDAGAPRETLIAHASFRRQICRWSV